MKYIAAAILAGTALQVRAAEVINLKKWEFSKDSAQWEQVRVPHDWAISGPFDKKWDLQTVAIEQNGEKVATEKSGRSGALPWIGKGYYRTTFKSPKCKHAEILFDGAMSEPVVYVNGQYAGRWAYGYNAFRLDITRLLKPEGEENTIEVSLKNLEESSRWYPGAGLYRPVKIITNSDEARIDIWGTAFRTLSANEKRAELSVDVSVAAGCCNGSCCKDGAKDADKKASGKKGKKVSDKKASGNKASDIDFSKMTVEVSLIDKSGSTVASSTATPGSDGKAAMTMSMNSPKLWSPETPYLYTLQTTLKKDGKIIDTHKEKTGIRTISVSKEYGFQLNGKSRKFKGVCLHHDLGPLGAAVNKAALIRQVLILKDMGCDAIRTSHNMPSKMQMEVYDSLGMMVMAESTDTWRDRKVKNGYNRFYDEWIDKDITNLILNHRNHPSIVMWSIGNEIPEQWKKEGTERAKHLVELCHQLDPTRTVTAGCDQVDGALKSGFLAALDVPGLNYRVHKYEKAYKELPQGFLLGSETTSTVSSRGEYFGTLKPKAMAKHDNGQSSGYDNEYCSWSNLPDDDWALQDDKDWVIGEFVWTGFDYLGEPTPYDEYWPSRSSYFGICDLAGLPKDRFYLYRSRWNKKDATLHLVPHWTWPGMEGKTIPVECYTNSPEAELFVNGVSQGRAKKYNAADPASASALKTANGTPLNRYRLLWENVTYQPGTLKVVSYDANGKKTGEQEVRTAGEPEMLKVTPDRKSIKAGNDEDLIFITITATDRNGNLCPAADQKLKFNVSGSGFFRAVCNGDATSLEPFTEPQMKLFHGQLVLVVQSNGLPGNINISVTSEDGKLRGETAVGSF